MDDRNAELLPLEDIVEVDEAYVGGAPKSLSWAYNPRGKCTGKPMIFVAASWDRQARARGVSDDKRATLEPVLLEWIDPETTRLMTDGSKSDRGLGKKMADHQDVIHSQKEYANPETGARVNTAEAVISQVQRALVGGNRAVRQMEDRIRELERQLGRKTLEAKILKEALDKSRSCHAVLNVSPAKPWRKPVADRCHFDHPLSDGNGT